MLAGFLPPREEGAKYAVFIPTLPLPLAQGGYRQLGRYIAGWIGPSARPCTNWSMKSLPELSI